MYLVGFLLFAPSCLIARLYFFEWRGSFEKTNAVIWKKPKKWQLITVSTLWGLIIVTVTVLILGRN